MLIIEKFRDDGKDISVILQDSLSMIFKSKDVDDLVKGDTKAMIKKDNKLICSGKKRNV